MHDAQGKGTMKEQGQLQNCSSLQSPAIDSLQRSAQSPLIWIQCFSLSLEAPGQGEEGRGEGGRELPRSCKRECFLLKESHYHQI